MTMQYLNSDALKNFDTNAFENRQPYPWANPTDLVTAEGYKTLRENLPDINLFTKTFGRERKHGQKSHDRYSLKYDDSLEIPAPWKEFIAELHGEDYTNFIRDNFSVRSFDLSFFWFFTPAGCSVSPHCDHRKKAGVHLLYLNTDQDWNQDWGGETLILGSDKKIKRESAPEFEDFSFQQAGDTSGLHTLLFKRTPDSWHGVREITCPEGHLRKAFMVSFQRKGMLSRFL